MNKPLLAFFATLVVLLSSSCVKRELIETSVANARGPFFGLTPSDEPKLLAADLIATPAQEYNGTFSPDGTVFFYTVELPGNAVIAYTEMQADRSWSEPKVATFSGNHADYDPLFSPDGTKLYFSSKRPLKGQERSRIWFVERIEDGWSSPKVVVLTDTDQDEYYNSLTHDGTIYFNIWSTGDLYKARRSNAKYQVERLPETVNEKYDKGDPFISPDEDYLIFRGYRKDTLGRGDLYITFRINGQWTEPENLGEPINSTAQEMCPAVTSDGKMFIFSSTRLESEFSVNPDDPIQKIKRRYNHYDNGQGNIYYMSSQFIDAFREKHHRKNSSSTTKP